MVRVQGGEVWVDVVVQATADDDTYPLHDVVACHVDRVFFPRKDFRCGAKSVDLLDRNHIGVQLTRVLGQASEVFVRTRGDIGWQFAVAGRAGGQPVEVPGRDLKVGGERRQWKK